MTLTICQCRVFIVNFENIPFLVCLLFAKIAKISLQRNLASDHEEETKLEPVLHMFVADIFFQIYVEYISEDS